ncbi:putative gamma-secretase subunit PEN-2 [Citrus sinensis]|nr:putative gamma-secretase subunit PEN-2 [Citrus sinensis]
MDASQSNDRIPNPNPRGNNGNSITLSTPVWPTIDGPLGLTEDDSLSYARKFYQFGFALLPFLWAVNCFYFWPVLRHSASFPRIRHCSLSSSIFMYVWVFGPNRNRKAPFQEMKLGASAFSTWKATYVLGSAVGFAVFTVVLLSWALTFAIGGEHLFGSVWDKLVMYNVAERLGLTGWS